MNGDFYRSKDWINLVKIIRNERLNESGFNVCEYCGKPIAKKFDCIAHHVIHLTDENINDVSISLNPDNIQLLHHRCHNKIHDRLGLSIEKQVFLVYGSPFAGKTKWVNDNMNTGDLIVSINNIWQCVSGSQLEKPKRLKSIVFSIRDALIDKVRVRSGNWLNAYVIGGYPLISERNRLIKTLNAREIFISTSKDECLNNLYNTENMNVVENEKYINEWWEHYGA